jgi:hypothetical protein
MEGVIETSDQQTVVVLISTSRRVGHDVLSQERPLVVARVAGEEGLELARAWLVGFTGW